MFLRRNLVSNCRFARYIGTPAEASPGMRGGRRCQNAHYASEVPHRIRPRTRMSDRNGTPTFYENTMRLAAARCFRRFGTKMKQISRLWNKVARLQRSFGPRWGEAATGAANAPARRRQIATFSQLSSNFVPSLFHSALGTMFSKNAKFGRGSISVAHTGPGPNLMRYFACVVRVSGAFCLSSQEVPCWCLCPS